MTAATKSTVSKLFLVLLVAAGLSLAIASQAFAEAGTSALQLAPGALETQATSYNLWVGGRQVTSSNAGDVLGDGGSVKYAPASQTLTLKNAKISKGRWSGDNSQVVESISYKLSGTLTVKLVGKNVISAPRASSVPSYAFGIADWSKNKAKLKITGSGSLTVHAADAALSSQAIAVWKGVVVQGSAKLYCYGGNSARKSTGIEAMGGITVKGSSKIVASGQTGAFTKAPKFSGYTPKVKAGYSSKDIRVNKNKPAKSTYTKYPYAKITKAASSKSSSSAKKPAKMKLTKIDVLSGQFLVHWNKLSKNCKGYQMQVAESSKFPANATRNYALITDKKYEGAYAWGLNPGTKYYVRVRAYNVVSGKKVWGAYSNVKSAVAAGSPLRVG